jgi:hypothetical protein
VKTIVIGGIKIKMVLKEEVEVQKSVTSVSSVASFFLLQKSECLTDLYVFSNTFFKSLKLRLIF